MNQHYPPELQAQIDSIVKDYNEGVKDIPPEVDQRPRFVFDRETDSREPGDMVRVYNGLDRAFKAGQIIDRVGRAWKVSIEGSVLIVHDPEDSWWDA